MVTKTEQYLNDLASKMGNGSVSVGFMEGATYPDGESVPEVAFKNEFGVPSKGQPPRPFFRRMIAKESPNWAPRIARLSQQNGFDGQKVLGIMGEDIKGGLQESINTLTEPALSPVTIARKGFSKPLIDTSHMLNSITYEVEE